MAMFELKDSEDIKTLECSTTAETLIKGEGVKRLEAEKCTAGVPLAAPISTLEKLDWWRKASDWFLEELAKAPVRIVVGLVVALSVPLLASIVVHYFGLKNN